MGVNRDSTNKDVLLGCLFNPWSVCLILGIVIGALVELVQDDTWEVIKRGGEGRVEMPIPGLYVSLYRWELEEELGRDKVNEFEFSRLLTEDAQFQKEVFRYLKNHDPEFYSGMTYWEFQKNIKRGNEAHYQMACILSLLSTPYDVQLVVGLYNFCKWEDGGLQEFADKLCQDDYRKKVWESIKKRIKLRVNRPRSYEDFVKALYFKPYCGDLGKLVEQLNNTMEEVNAMI